MKGVLDLGLGRSAGAAIVLDNNTILIGSGALPDLAYSMCRKGCGFRLRLFSLQDNLVLRWNRVDQSWLV